MSDTGTTDTENHPGTGSGRAGGSSREAGTGDPAHPDGPAPAARDADEHADAAARRLSTAPREDRAEDTVPALGARGWARWVWRQLTSMRVALILLFLLSLAAVPGSLIPQDSDAMKVQAFRARHTTLAPLYDRLGLFHVYGSVWFSAVYILLFVSLLGCIVPRCWHFWGAMRGRPPAAPRHLSRLPVYATWSTRGAPEDVLADARRLLRRRRFRVAAGPDAVASEKGYLREAGNLLFHVSLFGMLIAFAVGTLYGGQGTKLVVEGYGFSNTLSQYDDFTPGKLYSANDLQDFSFDLKGFSSRYATSGPQRGEARDFTAHVVYTTADGVRRPGRIKVNHPLEIGDSKVYLTAHGYAPVITVRNGSGKVVYSGPTVFLPQDSDLTSTGVVKVGDYGTRDGRETQLGFQGLFSPTYVVDPVRGPHSVFPQALFPVLSLTAYHGDLGIDSGVPQNVYQLDTSRMKQFRGADGTPLRVKLTAGQTVKLPDGYGSISFVGLKQWANFTVAHQPGNTTALVSAVVAVLGLIGSLFVQRRRMWVRAFTGPGGKTTVEVAGLARSESERLTEELAGLAVDLQAGAAAAEPGAEASAGEPAVVPAGASAGTGPRDPAATGGATAALPADRPDKE